MCIWDDTTRIEPTPSPWFVERMRKLNEEVSKIPALTRLTLEEQTGILKYS